MRSAPVLAALVLVAAPLSAAGEPPATLHLTLDEAVNRALSASAELAARRAERRAAEAGVRGADAARRPSLDLSASYTRHSDIREFSTVGPDGTETVLFPNLPNQTRSRLSLSVPLYTGGRLSGLADAARSEREAAARDVEAGVAGVVLAARSAYWRLVTARESERVLGESLRSFEAHLHDAENRERFGMAPRNEVLAVQVERDRAELRRIEAAHAAERAHATLARLLALEPGQRVEPAEPLETPPPVTADIEALVAEALAARPGRAALVARAAAATALVGVERAAAQPQLRLGAGFDFANPNLRILPPRAQWEKSWDVGVSLSFRVFDGGRRSAAEARARARAEAVRHTLEALDRRMRLEVTERALELRTAGAALAVAGRAVEAAREGLRVATDRHREGAASSAERLDAETALLRAELDLTRSRAGLRLAAAGLERALGR